MTITMTTLFNTLDTPLEFPSLRVKILSKATWDHDVSLQSHPEVKWAIDSKWLIGNSEAVNEPVEAAAAAEATLPPAEPTEAAVAPSEPVTEPTEVAIETSEPKSRKTRATK